MFLEDYSHQRLPTEIDIPAGIETEDEISDYLSDLTGYCHKGYRIITHDVDSLIENPRNSVDKLISSAKDRAFYEPKTTQRSFGDMER